MFDMTARPEVWYSFPKTKLGGQTALSKISNVYSPDGKLNCRAQMSRSCSAAVIMTKYEDTYITTTLNIAAGNQKHDGGTMMSRHGTPCILALSLSLSPSLNCPPRTASSPAIPRPRSPAAIPPTCRTLLR